MRKTGVIKRGPALPTKALRILHEKTSKATLHEALLDLWLEHEGLDMAPEDLTSEQLTAYVQMIDARSAARRRQQAANVVKAVR